MLTSCWDVTISVTQPTREVNRLGSTVARLKLKGIDGDPHKRWMMWINSMQREKPYLPLTCQEALVMRACPQGSLNTGAAWLSSARVVRCWVKSRNERNPRPVLPAFSWGLAGDCRRQAGGRWGRRQVIMPLMPWAAHVLQWPVQRVATPRGGADPGKPVPVRIAGCNPPA